MLCLFIPVKGIPYNVTVFGVNGKGSGPNVSKITYAEEDGKYYHLMVQLTFLSTTVPRAPRDLSVERVNATHMIVSWTALSLVEARGHIIYYTVNYWPTSNTEDIKSINVPHNKTRVEISHLYGEIYRVQVSANTSVGKGRSANASSVYSPPGIYSTCLLIVMVG